MTKKSDSNLTLEENINKLQSNIPKSQQITIINHVYKQGLLGQQSLLELLTNRRIHQKISLSFIDSLIFHLLTTTNFPEINKELNILFPLGIVELQPNLKINYQYLQDLLVQKKFQEADTLTQNYLCELVGLIKKQKRQWLYFTDINLLPTDDLLMIDLLWRIYSLDKFGFSVQRKIWLSNSCNWNKLWETIGWTKNGNMIRYPVEFIWSIDAPSGHLPLFNQLRGIQVIFALFKHNAWTKI